MARHAVDPSWKTRPSQLALAAVRPPPARSARPCQDAVCTARFSLIPRLGEKTLLEGSIVRKLGVYFQRPKGP
jgi:hypothetical protein